MPTQSSRPLDEFYRFLWPSADDAAQRFVFLDCDLGGRTSIQLLRQLATEHGVGPSTVVLDAGCGKGRQACTLAQKFGCQVLALDLLEHNLRLARERAEQERVRESVRFVRASLESLPVRDATVDLIWCGDMSNHLTDVDAALRECARVARPGAAVLIYSALATELLEPAEATRICGPLAINPATLSATEVAGACARAGFRVYRHESTFDAGGRYFEAIEPDTARDVMRLARMIRMKSRVAERLGDRAFRQLEAYYLWNVYLLIGKLAYHVWTLER